MKNKLLEKTQRGNPHRLTLYQHIFPKKSIARFCNDRGGVSVTKLDGSLIPNLRPDNPMFCANRVWDQKAELIGGRIESAFQEIAVELTERRLSHLETNMNLLVSEMYFLWRFRFSFAKDVMPDQKLNMVSLERELSDDEQEILESKGVMYFRNDGVLPSRFITGLLLRRDIDIALDRGGEDMKWGVISAPDGFEFLCPDVSLSEPIIPISPELCLVSGLQDGLLSVHGIGEINKRLIMGSCNYWISRNPNKCPLLKRVHSFTRDFSY